MGRTGNILSELGSFKTSGVSRNFVRVGGGQQIRLRLEDRENRDLGAVAH